jgi:hypothetical protein
MIALFGLLSTSAAQEAITPEKAFKFIGQKKMVCGVVISAHHYLHRKSQPTFLKLRPDPYHNFSVVIRGSDRSKFENPPEKLYFGKEICVTGMIQSYLGYAEIIVKEPAQIKIR